MVCCVSSGKRFLLALSLLLASTSTRTNVLVVATASSSSAATSIHKKTTIMTKNTITVHARGRHPPPSLLASATAADFVPDKGNAESRMEQHHGGDEEAIIYSSDEEEEEEEETVLVPRGGARAAAASATESGALDALLERLKIGFYFALWYALNIVYNIVNKKVLNVLPAPLTVGSIQFGIGALYVATLWLFRLRSKPRLASAKARSTIRTVGFWHCIGQLFSMVSLGAGPVSFTHIVKALEPFFSALVSALYFGKWMHPNVYATLLPVVGGVGYACLKEKSFSWLAFGTAMGSNLAFALRAVLSKMAMNSAAAEGKENSIGTNITPSNMFGLVTCSAFFISIPLALATEFNLFYTPASLTPTDPLMAEESASLSLWQSAVEASDQGATGLIRSIILSGLFHYLNNEVMYLALGNVHPVTLAVGNTMKRVFIMVASVMVFHNQISFQAGVGSAVGISGVLLYSLTKQYYEGLEKKSKTGKQQRVKPKKASSANRNPNQRKTNRGKS